MKKLIVAIIGATVVLIGVAMLVLPGPGVVVIAGGLAILATEFIWARRALRNAKGAVAKVRRKSGLKEWLRRLKLRAGVKPTPSRKT
jgi:tellurite resistance protein TerC